MTIKCNSSFVSNKSSFVSNNISCSFLTTFSPKLLAKMASISVFKFVLSPTFPGIPQHFRTIAWQLLSGAQSTQTHDICAEYIRQSSPYEKAIALDIRRTFPELEFLKDGGRGQQRAFVVFMHLMETYRLRELYEPTMTELEAGLPGVCAENCGRTKGQETDMHQLTNLAWTINELSTKMYGKLRKINDHFTMPKKTEQIDGEKQSEDE